MIYQQVGSVRNIKRKYFLFRPARRVSTMEATCRLMKSSAVIQQASASASTSQAILPSGTVLLSHWSRSFQTLCSDWLGSEEGLLPCTDKIHRTGLHPLLRAGAEVPADSVPRPAGESRAGLCPGPGLRSTLSSLAFRCVFMT